MRCSGTLVEWNDERGFGFIEPHSGGARVFVHISAFTPKPPPDKRPQLGMLLTYALTTHEGKPRAQQVQWQAQRNATARAPHTQRARSRSAPPNTLLAYSSMAAFAALFYFVSSLWGSMPYALGWYGVLSVICFLAYAKDKSAAQSGAWRTPEDTLHGLALLGGWPGALLAQQWLRHKSSKASFQAMFWCTVVLNVAAFLALSIPASRAWLLQHAHQWLQTLRHMG